MNKVGVIGWYEKLPENCIPLDVTSRSKSWHKCFSPFFLGPVEIWHDELFTEKLFSKNVENAWQYSKVYPEHLHENGSINSKKWFEWACTGWDNPRAVRYPMGKGVKPVCSFQISPTKDRRLNYIEARKALYIPWYTQAVLDSETHYYDGPIDFEMLVGECYKYLQEGKEVLLVDFDVKYGYTFDDVLEREDMKLGHGYILADMVNKQIKETYETT